MAKVIPRKTVQPDRTNVLAVKNAGGEKVAGDQGSLTLYPPFCQKSQSQLEVTVSPLSPRGNSPWETQKILLGNRAGESESWTQTTKKSSDAQKKSILGEARFLRASAYFTAVRLWGDIPLITLPQSASSEDFFPTRSPQEKIYELIIQDLVAAEAAGLPWMNVNG